MQISYKKASVVFLIFVILVGIGMLYFAQDIKNPLGLTFLRGPHFYPVLLAALLIIFSIISIIDTVRKKEDEVIKLVNVKKPAVVLFMVLVWAVLYHFFDHFYALSAIAMFTFLLFLNPQPFSVKKVLKMLLYDFILLTLLYMIFSFFLKVQM